MEALLEQGEAYGKFAGGHAIRLRTPRPITTDVARAQEVIAYSWERCGVRMMPRPASRQPTRPMSANSTDLE